MLALAFPIIRDPESYDLMNAARNKNENIIFLKERTEQQIAISKIFTCYKRKNLPLSVAIGIKAIQSLNINK